jgi:16S rRNA (guanine(527)-N(7))-methyltransferase RsmG
MIPSHFREILERELSGLVALTDTQISQLERHYDLMTRWNQRMNLTSIRTVEEAITRHYCESLIVGSHLCLPEGSSIVDVGTGAGFPGIPIAILHPEFQVSLVESHQRKAVFLREATRQLPTVRVLGARVESITESFNLLVSRAVEINTLLPLLPKLATKAAFMLGEDDVKKLVNTRTWEWQEPIKVPWGDRRYLLFGCST